MATPKTMGFRRRQHENHYVNVTPAANGWYWIRCLTCDTTTLEATAQAIPTPYPKRSS